jgi:hypothetical protein
MFKKRGGKSGKRAQPKKKQTLADKVSKLVDEFFADSVTDEDPGVAIGIFYKGQKVIKCVGAANIEKKEKITSKTVFCVGSLAKQVSDHYDLPHHQLNMVLTVLSCSSLVCLHRNLHPRRQRVTFSYRQCKQIFP